ncbi:MAG TPA: Rdx family protein [Thermoanaerobaculia bacterium]
MPRASSLAAEIRNTLGIETDLVRGSGGIFVVSWENNTLFSKRDEGRFPSEAEIIEKLRALR